MIFPLNPNEILDKLELKPDMIAADFGSGSGVFTFPLAKKLEDGLVYALDIQASPLSVLKTRALVEKVNNVSIIKTDLEKGSKIQGSHLDVVLLINVLFQAEDKTAIIKEAKRTIKEKGRILIVENKNYLGSREIKKTAESLGLEIRKEFKAEGGYWGGVFEKTI